MSALSCVRFAAGISCLAVILAAQAPKTASSQPATPNAGATVSKAEDSNANYVLGPDDQLVIRAVGVDEFDEKGSTAPPRIDMRGYIDIPIMGKVKAAGLTVQQLEEEITEKLRKYVRDPQVTVTVAEFKSQPVSIVGSVLQPGVYHLTGQNTLVQVLSQSQGLAEDAGNKINITREQAQGPIPLPGATEDPSGKFYTATVNTKLLLDAKDPGANIKIMPNDVISVPKAEMVYVVGAVNKSGGFVLSERESISVLQAVSMAEGLERTSAASRAKIIRRSDSNQRVEIPTDLKKILAGQAPDQQLYANDILFVPTSGPKTASLRALEAAIQVGTGVAIYRR
ncbi:MAG: polysaccharide biosynthesis/export family protein [Acidobacteriaceae bacterium]|nr:polysaccharide biosynthesis/export family protein [Acidobacteriaceae bacterium]MBV9782125.1 polysaccharide biosynthesis/export family protein [Acidobacteriaceae bacterium]